VTFPVCQFNGKQSLVSTQIFKTVFRGYAARCAEVAMPFRLGALLFWGYAPYASGVNNKAQWIDFDNFLHRQTRRA
jgi:hypothetical protein